MTAIRWYLVENNVVCGVVFAPDRASAEAVAHGPVVSVLEWEEIRREDAINEAAVAYITRRMEAMDRLAFTVRESQTGQREAFPASEADVHLTQWTRGELYDDPSQREHAARLVLAVQKFGQAGVA